MQPFTQSSPSYPKTMDSATRIVRLCRIGKSSLGFSIRGGWEHGTGVYISEVHPGSEAFREGLKPGDQILRVNGFIIEQAIHEEVIALIKSSSRITLKVKSVGMIPIKSNRSETLSWKLIDSSKMSPSKTPSTTTTIHVNGNNLKTINNNNNHNKSSSNSSAVSSLNSDSNSNSSDGSNNNGHHHHHQHLHRTHHHSHHPGPPPPPPPCPVHSVWSTFSSKSSSSNRSSLSSSQSSEDQSSCPDKDLFTSYGMTHGDYMEARVFIRIAPGQGLGCSVVKGPSNYPGIFVQTIKEGGIAQESGLEVGDQIIAMNGLSMEPGDIEFNEAIARIKSTSQMTLTVRKKSGLSLFQQHHNHHHNNSEQSTINGNYSHSNQHHPRHSHHPYHHTNNNSKQRVKAIVHSPPISTTTNGSGISKAAAAAAVAAAAEEIYHSPLLNKNSSESSSSPFNGSSRFYPPSEHDYSMSEVESNGNYVMRIPIGHENSIGKDSINSVDRSSPGRSDVSAATAKIYDKVRREEERLAEERKKLESEQKRLQAELEKLEKERKQLENMKPQDDSKSISSSSTISGSGNPSISSSGSTSQLGFLDEIKKLAEKRINENGLITDTLNKTRNLEKMMTKGPKTLISGQDDENRKRHELLMEEFRAAHSKMFGSGERKLRDIKNIGSTNGEEKTINNNNNINNCNTINQQQNVTQINSQHSTNTDQSQKQQSNGLPNGQPKGQLNGQEMMSQNNVVIINNNINNNKLIESPVVTIKSIPPPIQQTITNSNGETVTILRTTSPCKKLIPPPIPVKKSTSSPIVTITSYESCKK